METVQIEAQSEAASFVPQIGCQCLSYRVGALEVIAGARDLQALAAKPHSSGIPILFPWPGRIDQGRFKWRGREHRMPVNEPARGHALHGLICDRPFRLVRRGPYYFRCELDSASDAELSAIWPYPFRLEIDYEIGDGLRMAATVTNTGRAPMPFGIGTHPYFRAPLVPGASRAAMRLQFAGARRMLLDERLIPSGDDEPVRGKYDLLAGQELYGESYDDVFRAPAPDADGSTHARLICPQLKVAIEVSASSDFGYWVIYAPADRPVVSLEPYSCAPDAFNLSGRGIDAGVIELAPGASWRGSIGIRLSAP